jgi:hypothetical protein
VTVFLIFICALLITFALVLWGLGMVALRLAPLWVSIQRRKTSYAEILKTAEVARDRVNAVEKAVLDLQVKLDKLEEDQVNEVLARRR